MLKFFYLYKVAPGIWFTFAMASIAEFIVFLYLHARTNRLINNLKKDFENATGFVDIVTADYKKATYVYAAYCNLTIFIFLWLSCEWVLSVFRYPEVTTPHIWLMDVLRALFAKSDELRYSKYTLSLADEKTREVVTGYIIFFMIPTLVLFCETLLVIFNYPFGIVRYVTSKVKQYEVKMREEKTQTNSLWRIIYLYVYRFIGILSLFEWLLRWIETQMGSKNIAYKYFLAICLVPIKLIHFIMNWIYIYGLPPIVLFTKAIYKCWVKDKNGKPLIFAEFNNSIDSLYDRMLITIYSALVIFAQVFLIIHLFLLLTGGYNPVDCQYYILMPSTSSNMFFESIMFGMSFLSLTVMCFFFNRIRKDRNWTERLFVLAMSVHLIVSVVVLYPRFFNPLISKIIPGDIGFYQIRGIFIVSIAFVLLSGAWFMSDIFFTSLNKIYNYYITNRSEALSYEILHEMKNRLHRVSGSMHWMREVGIDELDNSDTNKRNEVMLRIKEEVVGAENTVNEAASLTSRLVEYARVSEVLSPACPVWILEDVIKHSSAQNEVIFSTDSNRFKEIRANINYERLKMVFRDIVQNYEEQKLFSRKWQEPCLFVDAWVSDNKLVIEIYDNLGGVQEDDLQKIGQPFFSTKRNVKESGFGLGLFNARKIIQFMGGMLEFYNKSVIEAHKSVDAHMRQSKPGVKTYKGGNIMGFCVKLTLPIAVS